MKKLLLPLMLLFLSLQGNAQMFAPVEMEHSIDVKGNEATIRFDAFIEGGYHMYSTDIPAGGPQATTISFSLVEGAELSGSLFPASTPHTEYDEIFEMNVKYFENEAAFLQKVKLLGGKYHLKGTVRYQSCREGGCIPGSYSFDIEGEAPVAVAKEEPVKAGKTADKVADVKKDAKKEEKAGEKKTEEKPVVAEPEEKSTDVAEVADSEVVVESLPVQEAAETVTVAEDDTWAPVKDKLSKLGGVSMDAGNDDGSRSLLSIFVMGFLGGLIALVTPCVWPIIPMTVSFFLKRSKQRGQAIREAVIYGASIVVIYLVLGLAVTLIFGAGALNALSTSAVFNIFFFLMLVVFGASFLGGFELTLPSSWTNKVDNKASSTTGLLSIFLMAFTLVLVSFSCTGPIIGFLLVEMTSAGAIFGPAMGMLGFALALALPFTIFALFPSLLKQTPRSGGWMNTIKVVLGFVEIAFALKFLSVADLTMHWGLLDRETFLVIWIVLFALLGLYLLKIIRFPHDDPEDKTTSVPGFFAGLISLAFAVYMIPGLWGAPCSAISAFAPPVHTQDFNLYDNTFKPNTDDYDMAIMMSRNENKPVMLDFTGHGCVNCREMESDVLSNETIVPILKEKYVVVSLYVDDRTPLAEPYEVEENGVKIMLETVGDKWAYLQRHKFGANAQPFYVLVDGNGEPLMGARAHDTDVEAFREFLVEGEKKFKTAK